MSAEKAFKASETKKRELLEGAKEKNVLPDKGSLITSIIFLTKANTKKLSWWPDLLGTGRADPSASFSHNHP